MALDTAALSQSSRPMSANGRRLSLRSRIMRWLVPATLIIFLIAGVAAALVFVLEARADLRDQQGRALDTMAATSNQFIADTVSLAQDVAAAPAVQGFASALNEADTPTSMDVALNGMLGYLTRVMERYYPDVLSISFITGGGSIWGTVKVDDDGSIVSISDAQVDLVTNDSVVQAALAAPAGQAVARPVTLIWDPTTTEFDFAPVMPVYMPVLPEGGMGETAGLIAMEVRANDLLDGLTRATTANQVVLGDTRSLALDSAGRVLFDSENPFVAEDANPNNLAAQQFPSINAVLGTQESMVLAAAGQDVVSTKPIRFPGRSETYLSLVAINDLALLQEAGLDRAVAVLAGALISALVLCLIAWIVLGRVTRPMQKFADELAGGAASGPADSGTEPHDEAGFLMSAYRGLKAQNEHLTGMVAEQNRRFTRTFDIAARVSSEAAALTSLDDLLNRTIEQICREYEFYHAQVFLLDDVGQDAVLVYSYGEAGRQLLERKHRLAVGSNSLVGQASESGFPMIVNDTANPGDMPWRFNPLLPDTRAEMALPLNIGDQVIGVLDLQSTNANAFETDDMQAYLLLTDQIAIAVNNARLLQQSQQRIEQIDILNRQLTRSAWEETSAYAAGRTYTYDLMNVADEPAEAVQSGGHEVPIAIRGEVVGNLHTGGSELSHDDEALMRAVADRVGIALENARLFQQTETALSETRRLYSATRAITSAPTPSAVYSAAAEHLSSAAPATSRVSVLLAAPTQTQDAPWYEMGHLWTRAEGGASSGLVRIAASTIPLGAIVERAGGVLVVRSRDDLAHEPALDALIGQHGSQSALLTPIHTRQRWFGLILIESDSAGVYDDEYAQFAVAVADQMAVALEGQTLFDEAQDQALRALALAEAGQLASRVGAEFTESLGTVFERIAEVARYDRWELLLLDESGQNLLPVLSRFGDEADLPADPLAVQSPAPMASVFRERRPLLINDPIGSPLYAELDAEVIERLGKHILYPVRAGESAVGVLSIGRSLDEADLDDRDEQLVVTLAAQIGIAVENRRLFLTAETERQTLRTILETLPAGVLVLDPVSFKPLQANAQAQQILGEAVTHTDQPITVEALRMFRAGTDTPYPADELPIFAAAQRRQQVASDDIFVRRPDGSETSLLVNAAPLIDAQGSMTAIVVAFEDISPLRSLENTLQVNLRDTVILYESTRALAEAEETEDVLDQVISQLAVDGPSDVFVLLLDEEEDGARVARSLSGQRGDFPLPADLLANQVISVSSVASSRLNKDVKAALLGAHVAAVLSIPLRARSRRNVPLGWLVMTYDRPTNLASRQQFTSTLAESAAVALDNRALFRSTQLALQETASLYNATSGVSASRDADALTEAIKAALEQLNPDLYTAVLVTEGQPVSLFNVNMDGAPVDFGSLLVNTAALQGAGSLFVDDVRAAAPASGDFERAVAALGTVRAFGMVHLRVQGQPAGALIAGYHQPRRFSSGDQRYLSAVADSASVVADNILLLDQIQANLRETSVLYEATRALADARTPADVLEIAQHYLGGGKLSQAFIALLNRGDWARADANASVAASWQSDETALGLEGVTLTPETFPAWPLLASSDVLVIGDVQNNPAVGPMEAIGLETMDLRSLAVLPLRSTGRAIGALVLASREVAPFAESDARVFSSFAEQAGLRLEATRLVQQTERRARQLATSAQVSSIASSILDLTNLLPRLVDTIRDQFGYDHAQIFLMDEANRFAVLRASTGEAGRQLLENNHQLQRGSQSVIGQVTATGRPVIAADTADARVIHRPNPLLPNTRSEMAIPLMLKGQVVGALDVQSNQPNFFDEDDIAVLTTLAAQVSVAIDNAQLFAQSSQRASEMSFLFGVTNAAASSDSLNEALDRVAGELVASLDALSATMYLQHVFIDGLGNERVLLQPVSVAGGHRALESLPDIDFDSDELVAKAARERTPQILDSLADAPHYHKVASNARSAIIVPLSSGTQLTGVVLVESDVEQAFGPQALTLMLTLSGSLSAIVQNQQLLEQMQETNEQLRELDRLKSDFLANMSHELRTPLNSIIGFSKVILKGIDGPLTEMQEQDLTTIYTSGQHLLNLINEILDQAKIAAGKMDLHFDYFDMKSVIDAVRSIGIGLVKDKPISIHVEIAPGLPQPFGDELRTRQVLINLMSNAAKFTHEGAITIRAYKTRDAETGRDMVRTDVIDSGIGIAEDDIPLLFEAFRQVDSSLTRTVGGTGLGLAIARSLIEIMGGAMTVESVLNVGSTFSVILPIEPVEAAPEAPAETQVPLTAPANGGNGSHTTETLPRPTPRKKRTDEMKVPASLSGSIQVGKRQALLIEDNPDMVDQYRRLLQREGFDVFTASIPLEAEAMASGLHPTVIIMEASFADGAAWDILQRLQERDDTSDIPVIIVSLADVAQAAVNAGAFRTLRRPFGPESLIQAVNEAERESRTERILIIDDQPESVRLLTGLLSEQGRYRLFSAGSGAEGVSLVARRRPDLILLDVRMPDKDGFTVVDELRNNPETRTIPIMVVTGDTLSAQEMERLNDLPIVYKSDLLAGIRREFLDEVRASLTNAAAGVV